MTLSLTRTLDTLLDTQALATLLAPQLRAGDVVFLMGDLGAGKTTFAQFLIQTMSEAEVEVTSPTFTLLQTYPVRYGNGQLGELYHYDLYRVEHESALIELGLEEALENITLMEWPEHLGSYKLAPTLVVSLAIGCDSSRIATLTHVREGITL